jgi:serine/threonine-protein kinase HipA
MRKAEVRMHNIMAGWLSEVDTGFQFVYDSDYLKSDNPVPVSLTLPLQEPPFLSNILFSFFDGLIPEGWLLDIVEKNWKLNPRDRMGLLLVACIDCIGAVSVHSLNEVEK